MMHIIAQMWDGVQTWALGWGGLSGLIGVIALALWFITPGFLSSTEARAVLLNIGLGCVAFAFVSGYFIKVGYQTCINIVATNDRATISRAANGVKAIESCRDNGGSWNIVEGTCTPKP